LVLPRVASKAGLDMSPVYGRRPAVILFRSDLSRRKAGHVNQFDGGSPFGLLRQWVLRRTPFDGLGGMQSMLRAHQASPVGAEPVEACSGGIKR